MHVKASQPSAVEAASQSEFTDLSKAWDPGKPGNPENRVLGSGEYAKHVRIERDKNVKGFPSERRVQEAEQHAKI